MLRTLTAPGLELVDLILALPSRDVMAKAINAMLEAPSLTKSARTTSASPMLPELCPWRILVAQNLVDHNFS